VSSTGDADKGAERRRTLILRLATLENFEVDLSPAEGLEFSEPQPA
jgi:hypothetical protein